MDLKFAPIVFPEPKFRVAVKALSETDDEKVGEILHKVKEEDPTYLVKYSKELKQLIVEGHRSDAVSVNGSQRRTRFSASTREVYGNLS